MPTTDLFADSLSTDQFSRFIKEFRFEELFVELGWDRFDKELTLQAGDYRYDFEGIVEKRGFTIFQCLPKDGSRFPRASERDKLDRRLTKLHNEHLVIYGDRDKTRQLWEYRLKEPNQPDRRRREEYYTHQEPSVLLHKLEGLFFSIGEEDQISIIDVKKRVTEQFDRNYEKVTKKFYKKFKKEHEAFRNFIEGIEEQVDKDWYASLMLNRLMFVYFIQKKGLLNEDREYLSNKLNQVQNEEGENEFYSFYTDFLTTLFHKGLGHPDRTTALEDKLGKVPYLNGGLFDVHELESKHSDLKIKDDAFERLFEFFDEYNWYLDNRKQASGQDINPDVIGYIFEKYINDRADMGAYYTQEDITDYISKNCILPWLFDEAERHNAHSFSSNGEVWNKLQQSGDTYIYDAVKKGVGKACGDKFNVTSVEELDIPENIAKGLDTEAPDLLERREDWNTQTPKKYALPTEIWRETIERWQRYFDIRGKIETGKLHSVNDFITYNLDIKQFTQDLIEETDDPELIKACWKGLSSVTILDPTCGSGAFLFAALNILEPLYEACVQKMEAFAEEGNQSTIFADVLSEMDEHPNREYYIYKSIILNNLYGVDIMHEATEIAKLRLFLKLMGTVEVDYTEPNLGLEPLPDIDFNIRSGNTLVGYATEQEFKEMASGTLDFDNDRQKVLDQADIVNKTFKRFKEKQLTEDYDNISYKKAKDRVNEQLDELNEKLNRYLALSYLPSNYSDEEYKEWLNTHQPFHWFAEFYSIIQEQNGFDVVIGNPPYIEKNKIDYRLVEYLTIDCGNLYAICYERATYLSQDNGKIGFIIPVASVSTGKYESLRTCLLNNGSLFISSYNDRPGKLFTGLEHIRLSIILLDKNRKGFHKTTGYLKWNSVERKHLFNNLNFVEVNEQIDDRSIPKLGENIGSSILSKIRKHKEIAHNLSKNSNNKIYFTRKLSWFVQILDFIPTIEKEDGSTREPSELKSIEFNKKEYRNTTLCSLNSSLFYWYLTVWSDCRNLNKGDVKKFNFDPTKVPEETERKCSNLKNTLMEDLQNNSDFRQMTFKSVGTLNIQCIYPKNSKSLIDSIDKVMSQYYQFTPLELDYIVNYDIKYRMGDELGKV